jgi:hypothetical protein
MYQIPMIQPAKKTKKSQKTSWKKSGQFFKKVLSKLQRQHYLSRKLKKITIKIGRI